ncbi:MAG: HigA family addiction module antidote protein [Rickettsiales bacterium]|nr:HigA family addiction module antidote protein [Rickettsiales bacterium]
MSKKEYIEIPTIGEFLYEEFMEPLNLSQSALARSLNVPQNRINEIINGKRGITADTVYACANISKCRTAFLSGYRTVLNKFWRGGLWKRNWRELCRMRMIIKIRLIGWLCNNLYACEREMKKVKLFLSVVFTLTIFSPVFASPESLRDTEAAMIRLFEPYCNNLEHNVNIQLVCNTKKSNGEYVGFEITGSCELKEGYDEAALNKDAENYCKNKSVKQPAKPEKEEKKPVVVAAPAALRAAQVIPWTEPTNYKIIETVAQFNKMMTNEHPVDKDDKYKGWAGTCGYGWEEGWPCVVCVDIPADQIYKEGGYKVMGDKSIDYVVGPGFKISGDRFCPDGGESECQVNGGRPDWTKCTGNEKSVPENANNSVSLSQYEQRINAAKDKYLKAVAETK